MCHNRGFSLFVTSFGPFCGFSPWYDQTKMYYLVISMTFSVSNVHPPGTDSILFQVAKRSSISKSTLSPLAGSDPHSSGPGPRPREPGMHVLQPLCGVPLCSVPEQALEGAGLVGACPMCDPRAPRDVSASQAAHARQHGAWVSICSLTASFTVKWLTRWVHSPRRTSQQSLAVGRCLL